MSSSRPFTAFLLTAIAGLALAAAILPAAAAASLAVEEVARPGRVLLLRHAIAPGVGDPPQFRLGDCKTQRNLDAAGRAQAVRLGERLRAAGVSEAKVYAGQWCRTLETARLLGFGPVTELPALNSFFSRPERSGDQLAALRAFLARLPVAGPPVILVTHQVTVTGLTGVYPDSGGGALLQLDGTTAPKLVGTLRGDY